MRLAYVIIVLYVGATLIVGLGIGASMLLGADSSDHDHVHVERIPVAPERPTELNATSSTNYSIEYEERRLYNGVIARHNHTLGSDENVITRCNATAVSALDGDQFHVRLRCVGGIERATHPSESEKSSYTVAYRITGTETNQTAIRDYPFGHRGTLEPPRA